MFGGNNSSMSEESKSSNHCAGAAAAAAAAANDLIFERECVVCSTQAWHMMTAMRNAMSRHQF